MSKETTMDEKQYRLAGFIANTLPKGLFLIGIIASLLSLVLGRSHMDVFWITYLNAAIFFASISLGSMFWVLIHHLTRAGWSVVIRRIHEVSMRNIILLGVLICPLFFGMHDLFHWSDPAAVAKDALLQVKEPYLNTLFFVIRNIVYLAIWMLIAWYFHKKSVLQDETGDPQITLDLQKKSTVGVLLYALSVSFFAIDWMMSLDAHWYSTIFGVYFFAGCALSSLAFVSIVAMILRKAGYLKSDISLEHFHDVGKLAFGFVVFWTYIAFSQFFLIWYANIPEETLWYMHRFENNWNSVSILLVLGHFVIPFAIFMSRHIKRNLVIHAIVALWLIVIHFIDLYWIIWPNFSHYIKVDPLVITTVIGLGGLFLGAFFKQLGANSILAIRDPRLPESRKFENI